MYYISSSIRFSQGVFADLRQRLLEDTRREAFALLLGRSETVGDHTVIKIVTVRYPKAEDYISQGQAHLSLKRDYVYQQLVEMQQRQDVDTLIDVHTHPFCEQGVAFSGVDDRDETDFHQWLNKTLDALHYGSIVLSKSDYSARLWGLENSVSVAHTTHIKTQTLMENWPSAEEKIEQETTRQQLDDLTQGFLARSALALGLDTLRQIMHQQSIAIIGLGGLGSVIAENLVHSGFQTLHLIDHDIVEITNLNRIVGAYYADAEQGRLKVDVVQDHLQRINPKARVTAHPVAVEDDSVLPILAQADWIIVATDNHASRFVAQQRALQYAVPLISSGVNISVEDGQITDMSGEVIIARSGDRLCLNCLKRINPTQVAAEQHKNQPIGQALIRRGYVSGEAVKEPAVKTLNAMTGAMAVDLLLNQYTQRQAHVPIQVYENNGLACIYPDRESIETRPKDCFHCH